MGTHISRVRSTILDSWDKEPKKVMMLLGNDSSKKIFEYNFDPNDHPLLLSSDRFLFFIFYFLFLFIVLFY